MVAADPGPAVVLHNHQGVRAGRVRRLLATIRIRPSSSRNRATPSAARVRISRRGFSLGVTGSSGWVARMGWPASASARIRRAVFWSRRNASRAGTFSSWNRWLQPGDHHQARVIAGDRRGQAFHEQGLQLMAREGAGEIQALHDRLGRLPGIFRQGGENVGIEGVGPVHVQDRAPGEDHPAGQGRPEVQDEGRSGEQGKARPGRRGIVRCPAGGPRQGRMRPVALGKAIQEGQEAIVLPAGDGTHPDHG